jgi:hypothetical protein
MKAHNTMEPYSQGTNQIITLIYVVWSKDDSLHYKEICHHTKHKDILLDKFTVQILLPCESNNLLPQSKISFVGKTAMTTLLGSQGPLTNRIGVFLVCYNDNAFQKWCSGIKV